MITINIIGFITINRIAIITTINIISLLLPPLPAVDQDGDLGAPLLRAIIIRSIIIIIIIIIILLLVVVSSLLLVVV